MVCGNMRVLFNYKPNQISGPLWAILRIHALVLNSNHSGPALGGSIVRLREQNNNWRGGRSITAHGYVLVRVGVEHHLADVRGYAYEHRKVAEEKLGRKLKSGELVHHKNGDRTDNRPENLEVMASNAEHFFEHRGDGSKLRCPGEPNQSIECECGCGISFEKFDGCGRPRRYVPGHNRQPSPLMDSILVVLANGPLSRTAISLATSKQTRLVATTLSKLKRLGFVIQVRRGVWRKVDGK